MADRKARASWAILALAAAAVVAGLALTGGPLQARKERQDATRLSDLMSIWWQAQCQARATGNVLPAKLEQIPGCAGDPPRLQDPYRNEPYRYELLGPTSLRLCARLDLPEAGPSDRAGRGSMDPGAPVPDQPGCYDFVLRPPTDAPPFPPYPEGDQP